MEWWVCSMEGRRCGCAMVVWDGGGLENEMSERLGSEGLYMDFWGPFFSLIFWKKRPLPLLRILSLALIHVHPTCMCSNCLIAPLDVIS